ncbi:hypothetical protein BI036_gp119 [Morganella phage vB_MmoM_MP1]|uniref:Uncharacterized protein n=1 Tax=Morganella phage vB_MmoM_MP1 TaxID=1852628 RepID=A0A192YBT8_9CAUD|nr:hypothetical protein BI036_gp119 [Morganella phage vB_MmoM_MP1]ANM46595.1 hypothetical protein MP1_gp0118 [Morganella phage vB_MmoM_MP1]
MKLQRHSIKVQDTAGKWYFTLLDNDAELLEKADMLLGAEATPNNADEATWDGYSDQCSDYNGGEGVGYWIPVELVEAFKASWKKVKKAK